MLTITKLNESWVHIGGDYDEVLTISQHFTFMAPNYKWNPKYRSGIWDGKIRILGRDGKLPIGLFPKLKHICKKINIETEIDFKKTSIIVSEENVHNLIKELKCDIKIRPYQMEGVIASFKQQKCIVISPTASGKSFIQYLVAQLVLKINKNAKILLIVPTVDLVNQMKGDIEDYSLNCQCPSITKIYAGQDRNNDSQITISTWQSLAQITDPEWFQEFECVLVDEVHGASGTSGNKSMSMVVQQIINACTNAKMKIGVSGTIQDEVINKLSLEGMFGKINQFTTTKELMDNGTLSKLKINFLVLKYPNADREACYKIPYPDEIAFLRENKARTKFILKCVTKINKNILVLFRNIDYGKDLYNQLDAMKLDRNVHYVSGETKAEVRKQTRLISTKDNNGIIIASIGVFATGINIPSLDYVLFAQTQKAKIKVLQSIGRVLRKTKTKNKAVLIDIVDDLTWKRKQNYSMKHGIERMEIYDKEKFDYNIKEIDLGV
jgi:superfamily II DNA or RNA helicase